MKKTLNFKFKEGNYRIISSTTQIIQDEIINQRKILDKYIENNPDFKTSLVPVKVDKNAPEIVQRMHQASLNTGIGPMASVAGIIAEFAAIKGFKKNNAFNLVENGGDIYCISREDIKIGLYTGNKYFSDKLALYIKAEKTPISICSSSSNMGHSLSFGTCDLATVFSLDGALADSAATLACNQVKSVNDLEKTSKKISEIKGIFGIILVKDDKIAIAGDVPEIIKNKDPDLKLKITKDINNFEILK